MNFIKRLFHRHIYIELVYVDMFGLNRRPQCIICGKRPRGYSIDARNTHYDVKTLPIFNYGNKRYDIDLDDLFKYYNKNSYRYIK